MDDQLKHWQQEFQQSTPSVDSDALAKQVNRLRKVDKFKTILELILSLCVSTYCIYSALFIMGEDNIKWLFLLLSPIPIGFSVWAFKLRHQRMDENNLSVMALLNVKRHRLYSQLKYWRVSAILVTLLWLGLVAGAMVEYVSNGNASSMVILASANAPIWFLTLARFGYLHNTLKRKEAAISALSDA